MYVIFSGECGIYVINQQEEGYSSSTVHLKSHRAVATLGANTVIGEKAVVDKFDTGRRNATVVAHNEVVTLVLTKDDY